MPNAGCPQVFIEPERTALNRTTPEGGGGGGKSGPWKAGRDRRNGDDWGKGRGVARPMHRQIDILNP